MRRNGQTAAFRTAVCVAILGIAAYLFQHQNTSYQRLKPALEHLLDLLRHLKMSAASPDREVLPKWAVPLNYDITLTPDLENGMSSGKETVRWASRRGGRDGCLLAGVVERSVFGAGRVKVNQDTNKIAINAAEMEIHSVHLVLSGTAEK
jgi:hypothetical protein